MEKMIVCFTCYFLILLHGYSQNSVQSESPTVYQKLAHDIFKELIEINTTREHGSTQAAEAMAARLEKGGFQKSDIQIVGSHPQHLNLIVRYHGTGNQMPILFFGHLDVVEALLKDWENDPFVFRENDGFFYGRGTSDMKCEDADIITNLIRLKQEGFIPKRDIIVALTDGEEMGDYNGIQWLLENHRDYIGSAFAINLEGGGGTIKNGKNTMMEIQTSEKIYLDFSLEAKNKGGHSSLPVKDNAIYHLAEALTRIDNYDFPIRLNETTKLYFERSALQESGPMKYQMLEIGKPKPDTNIIVQLSKSSPYYNSMLRTTCVATLINGGHARNALPQSAVANINCRMLPDDTPDNVLKTLKSVVADSQVIIKCDYQSVLSLLSPLRQEVMAPLEKLTAAMWPGVTVTPVMSTGASDGRYLRAAGIPVYGVSGIFADIDDVRAHGKDERIGVKEFYKGIEFMYLFIKELTNN